MLEDTNGRLDVVRDRAGLELPRATEVVQVPFESLLLDEVAEVGVLYLLLVAQEAHVPECPLTLLGEGSIRNGGALPEKHVLCDPEPFQFAQLCLEKVAVVLGGREVMLSPNPNPRASPNVLTLNDFPV